MELLIFVILGIIAEFIATLVIYDYTNYYQYSCFMYAILALYYVIGSGTLHMSMLPLAICCILTSYVNWYISLDEYTHYQEVYTAMWGRNLSLASIYRLTENLTIAYVIINLYKKPAL